MAIAFIDVQHITSKKIKINYETIKNNFPYEMDENNNIIYYINNNVYNDSKIPLIKYLKTIEKYGTEAGDLEISSASKNQIRH